MLYHLHNWQNWGLKTYFGMMANALSWQSHMLTALKFSTAIPRAYSDMARVMAASAEVTERLSRDYDRPEFDLDVTRINGRNVAVNIETCARTDFGSLIRFHRDTTRNDPKVLIVVPTSGHYATLLRDFVRALLPGHDVYMTDWENARDVPRQAGSFGLEDYITHTQDFIRTLGPDTHVIGFSQSTIPLLAAVSLMAARKGDVKPLSMTLMGGPIDTRAAHSDVSRFAMSKKLSWFRDNLITTVPSNYKGSGRDVYPGFLQLVGFMSMNPNQHVKSHLDLFNLLTRGSRQEADEIKAFYNEYLAVSDLHAKFYLDTIDQVFQRHTLPRGEMLWRGERVDPSKIRNIPLLTIEGQLDDITCAGQTLPAHGLCTGLPRQMHFHHTQPGIGHYGIISGKPMQGHIVPRLAAFMRIAGARRGMTYDPAPGVVIAPHTIDPVPYMRYLNTVNALHGNTANGHSCRLAA